MKINQSINQSINNTHTCTFVTCSNEDQSTNQSHTHVRLWRALTKINQSINNSLCLNICSFILWQGPCTQQARRSRHVEGQQCLRIATSQTGHTRPHWRIQSTIFGGSFCRVFSHLTSICSFSSLSLSLFAQKLIFVSFSPSRRREVPQIQLWGLWTSVNHQHIKEYAFLTLIMKTVN